MGDRAQSGVAAVAALVMLSVLLPLWYVYMLGYTHRYPAFVQRPVSPSRIVAAVVVPLVLVNWHFRSRNCVPISAALAAAVISLMTLVNYCFLSTMLTYFAVGLYVKAVNRAGPSDTQVSDAADSRRLCSSDLHTLGSCVVVIELVLLFYLQSGSAEMPIDFVRNYESAWFSTAVLGTVAGLTGDTFATRVGLALATDRPRLITTWSSVPAGTHGGVSTAGTAGSAVGGLIVGLVYYATVTLLAERQILESSPPQYPILLLGLAFGVIGSIVDSILGATVQYTGFDYETMSVVEGPGPYVYRVAGTPMLDNVGVDVVSSFVTSLVAPHISLCLWKTFA